MRDDFAVFILTHGRANNVKTASTLKRYGYSGKLYFVIDNEDDQADEYRKNFGDENVLMFDKLAVSKTFDTMDLCEDRRTIVYARNVCFDLAKQVGVRYFLELDDDYTKFEYRWIEGDRLKTKEIKNVNRLFENMIDFLIESQADTVALAQGGDLIGGKDSKNFRKRVLRKAMNTFFCDAEKPFQFIGRINEDVNTYTRLGSTGWIGLTVMDANICQATTQKSKGGMSDVYIDNGTYVKSFYTVMQMPSCTTVKMMGDKHKRMHHHIEWINCVPMILNEKYRKRERIIEGENSLRV